MKPAPVHEHPVRTGRETFLDLYREFFDNWNALKFWEAHESLEQAWKERHDDEKLFLQGLIQGAGAFYHIQRQRRGPALVLFVQSIGYLERYRHRGLVLGIDVPATLALLNTWQAATERQPSELLPDDFPAEPFPALSPAWDLITAR